MFSLSILFLILTYISKQEWAKQRMVFLFFIVYGANRFWIEFLRSDKSVGLLGLTGAQLLCLGFVLFGIVAYFYYTQKWKKRGMPEVIFK